MGRQAIATATAILAASFALGILLASPVAVLLGVKTGLQLAMYLAGCFMLAYGMLGLPIHAVLRRKRLLGLKSYAVAGAATGLILSPLALFLDSEFLRADESSIVRSVLAVAFSSASACVAATAFWVGLSIQQPSAQAKTRRMASSNWSVPSLDRMSEFHEDHLLRIYAIVRGGTVLASQAHPSLSPKDRTIALFLCFGAWFFGGFFHSILILLIPLVFPGLRRWLLKPLAARYAPYMVIMTAGYIGLCLFIVVSRLLTDPKTSLDPIEWVFPIAFLSYFFGTFDGVSWVLRFARRRISSE